MSRDQLIEENMNLVYYLINRYYPTFSQDEDVIQEGMIGLIKAASCWDASKSKFSSYASICILNQIRNYFKVYMKGENHLSLDKVLSSDSLDDGTFATFGDLVVDEECGVDFELVEDDEFISTLSKKEQEIIKYYKLGYRKYEIANLLGISRHTLYRIISKIKKKWRN